MQLLTHLWTNSARNITSTHIELLYGDGLKMVLVSRYSYLEMFTIMTNYTPFKGYVKADISDGMSRLQWDSQEPMHLIRCR